jgi:multiple sugar transport system substrate-binding protein
MKLKTRFTTLILLCLLVLPVISIHAQESVTLTMWTHDGLYVEFFTARAQEWAAEQHPDINFTFDFQVVADVETVVLANLAAGQPLPDMLGMEQGHIPLYMRDGVIADVFVDLTDRIGDNYSRIAEGRWSIYTYNGGIYGVDSGLSTSAYYYQPSIYESLGIEVPTTWEEFLEAGSIAKENGTSLGVIMSSGDSFQMYLLQRGAEIFDAEGNFVLGTEENRAKALEVLNLWRAGLDNGAFTPVLDSEFWGPTTIQLYDSGTVAGIVMPDWYGDYILKPQAVDMVGEWALAPMPIWADGTGYGTSAWGGTGFGITQASANIDLAWELLEYSYLSYEGQVLRYEEIGYYPTMIEAFQDERVVGFEDPFYNGQRIGEIWAATSTEVPVWYQSPYRAVFRDAVGERMPLFFDGSMDAETLIDEVIFTVEDEISFDN